MNGIANRIIRAMKLDPQLYEEVEHNPALTGQAAVVVILSSLAAGVGNAGTAGLLGLALGAVAALAGWYVWALITYLVGTRILPEPQTEADHGELLRTLGFASAPGLICVLGLIPGLVNIVFIVAGVWMLMATVVAVRQALDYNSTLRAVGVCLIGWIIQGILRAVILVVLARLAAA